VGDRGHPYDCFYFRADRARAGPEELLSSFQGYLQSDEVPVMRSFKRRFWHFGQPMGRKVEV
jgi:hypothetical protein